jgi:hypothetical protein
MTTTEMTTAQASDAMRNGVATAALLHPRRGEAGT